MRIGPIILDTENMTYSEVGHLVSEFRKIRERKAKARDSRVMLRHAVAQSKEHNLVYVNRYTGEIFNPEDWFVYDEFDKCTHGDEVDH